MTIKTVTSRIEQALKAAQTGLSASDLRREVRGRAKDFFIALTSLRAAGLVRVFRDRRETPDGRLRGVLVHEWVSERTQPGSCEPQAGSLYTDQTAEAAWAAEVEFGDAPSDCPACGLTGGGPTFCDRCSSRPGAHA